MGCLNRDTADPAKVRSGGLKHTAFVRNVQDYVTQVSFKLGLSHCF